MSSKTQLEQRLVAFADAKLRRDLPSRLKKLGEEFGELAEAIANGNTDGAIEEAADMSLVLTDIVHLLDGSSITAAMERKLSICEQRVYVGGSRVREIQ